MADLPFHRGCALNILGVPRISKIAIVHDDGDEPLERRGFHWLYHNMIVLSVGEAVSIEYGLEQVINGFELWLCTALYLDGNYQKVFLVWSIPAIVAASSWWFLIKETPLHPKVNRLPVGLFASLRRAFTNNHLWLLSILMFIQQFTSVNWNGWAPVLMMLKGASPELAGIVSSVTLWAMIPTFLLAPRLSHRIGLRKPFLWAPSILLATVFLTYRYVPINFSWLIMILVGIAAATRFTTLMSLPIEIVHETEVGMASGMLASIGFTGGVIGPLIGGRVLDTTGSLNSSLVILVIISVVAAIIASRIPETGPRARP